MFFPCPQIVGLWWVDSTEVTKSDIMSSLHPVVSLLCEEAHRERQQVSRREPSLLSLAHPSWCPVKQRQPFDCRPVKVVFVAELGKFWSWYFIATAVGTEITTELRSEVERN